jgi:hypothetical protein
MDIKINNKKFPKSDLIKLIARNKLQTIIHIRSIVNIGLKDAKKIVENLEENPNYYDNTVIKIAEKEFVEGETISHDVKNIGDEKLNIRERKIGSHIIKNKDKNRKWIYLSGLIFIIILLYFLMID